MELTFHKSPPFAIHQSVDRTDGATAGRAITSDIAYNVYCIVRLAIATPQLPGSTVDRRLGERALQRFGALYDADDDFHLSLSESAKRVLHWRAAELHIVIVCVVYCEALSDAKRTQIHFTSSLQSSCT